MKNAGEWRPFQAVCGMGLAALLWCSVPSQGWAQSPGENLLADPAFLNAPSASQLPPGYWVQMQFNSPCSGTQPYQVSYSYGNDAGGVRYLEIDVYNGASACSANYVLVMPMKGTSANLIAGANYQFKGNVNVQAYDGASVGSLGFHLQGPSSNYLGESPGFYANGPLVEQTPVADYTAGVQVNGGSIPTSVLSRLSVASIKPGEHVRLRLKNLSVTRADPPTALTVGGLVNPVVMAAAGKPLKLSVPLRLFPYSGGAVSSTVKFVDVNGVERATSTHPVAAVGTSPWGDVYDAWQTTLPSTLPPGRYEIRYSLSMPSASVQAGSGAVGLPGPGGTTYYLIGTLIVSDKAGMYVGQHFHRYPGPNVSAPLPTNFAYRFARSLNHDGVTPSTSTGSSNWNASLTSMGWWEGDGQYKFGVFDAWADFHAGSGASAQKRLLITFMGSPPWLSSNNNYDFYHYPAGGFLAAPKDLEVYRRMVTATVNKYKDRIFAVECWNEPDAGYFGPDPLSTKPVGTQLADVCKVIHTATKAVDPSIATICPQAAIPENMRTWLTVRTSQDEPITDYCDVVGAHAYARTGISATGADYQNRADGLLRTVRDMRATLQSMGIKKPIAITEAGFLDGNGGRWTNGIVFSQKSATDRAEISYQTLATARELGVALYGLYSFDGAPTADAPLGFEGNGFGTPEAVAGQAVNDKNAQAAGDFGAGATSQGLLPFALDLFMVPTVMPLKLSGNMTLNFTITVANTSLLPAKELAVSILPSISQFESSGGATGNATSSVYTIDSVNGPAGSTCTPSQKIWPSHAVTQWTCTDMNVPAGEFVTLQAYGHATPSSSQVTWMNLLNYKYDFTVSASVAWSNRPAGVSVPTVTSPKIVLSK